MTAPETDLDHGEALTAAAVAIHDVDCPDRTCSDAALGHSYRLAAAALEAAAPAIRREALPPCPACGCTLPGDPDARECGCDAGCNDGPHAPGINALIAAERSRVLGELQQLAAAETGRARQREISERAEEIHAEHHYGYLVPSLDSCPEHDRADYEAMVSQ